MWKNYLMIAWRNLWRRKLISILYISGLGIALLCVMFIGIYVHHESSFNNFLPDVKQIYRINVDGKMGPEEFLTGGTPPPVGMVLEENIPEVKGYTRMYLNSPGYVTYLEGRDKKVFKESRLFSVDSNFLQFFKFRILEGSQETSLQHPHSVVLTSSVAKRYFGNQSAIGKELQLDEWSKPFMVTAVLEDLPSNSSLQFDMLIPNSANPLVQRFDWSWVWLQMSTFVQLEASAANPTAIAAIEGKLPAMVKVQAAGAFDRIGKPYDEFIANGGRWDLQLQAMEDIHLGSGGIYSQHITHGNATTVNAFILTAFLIMLMACINSMNLCTAQALRRSKEVGVKKVLGSARQQLIAQFLVEAFLYNLFAVSLAVLLMALLIPSFNELTGKTFKIDDFMTAGHVLAIGLLVLTTTLFSGLYPAFYQSAFRPMSILNRNVNPNHIFSEKTTRNGLVVFQFMISTALIIFSIVVFKQIQYTNEVNLGFDKEHVLILDQIEKIGGDQQALAEEFRRLPDIQKVSLSTGVPTKDVKQDFYVPVPSELGKTLVKDIALSSYMVDDQFMSTMGMQLMHGRDFSEEFMDVSSVILNETAVRQIGWDPSTVVGNLIQYPGNGNQTFKVIGVVKDFNIESLHSEIMPFALFHFSSKTYYPRQLFISLRLEKGNIYRTLQDIEQKWGILVPDQAYQATFLDEEIESLYQADQRAGYTFWIFTLLAILIGCIGLFGLVTATVEQRIREIGVRKVMGASIIHIVRMLSQDFIKLVLIALFIASPLAWWAMDLWLQQFAYKVDVHFGYFILAFLIAVLFSFPTILFQTWKAAVSNPVEALRSE